MTYDEDSVAYDRPERTRPRRDGSVGIDGRMERVEKSVVHLDNELDRLAERLSPILGPERPSAALDGAPRDPDTASRVGAFLDSTADRVTQLAGRLSYLTERLDL